MRNYSQSGDTRVLPAGVPDQASESLAKPSSGGAQSIGEIVEVSGRGATAVFDKDAMDAIINAEDGDPLVGQIGSMVRIHVTGSYVYAIIRELKNASLDGGPMGLIAEMDFVGQGERFGAEQRTILFGRGVSKFPVPGNMVSNVRAEDVKAIFAPMGRAHVNIGSVYPHHTVNASILTDGMLSKHFAVLGSTGTGKSCTLALLVHRLSEQMPNGHIIILDPHDEYASAFKEHAECINTDNLRLPYWMMNLEEHIEIIIGQRTPEREVEVDILKRSLLAARKEAAQDKDYGRFTVDTPIPYRLADLLKIIDQDMGRLDKAETIEPYLKLKSRIEELKGDDRYSFMFATVLARDNLPDVMSRILRIPVHDKPVSIIGLAGVPSSIVDVVVSVLCRTVFDFAVWGRKANSRPVLLICEEAHRYIPEEAEVNFRSARKSIERIAKEGRKYGVSLGIVSQRPADLAESILSQCGTIFAMRMNNEKDQRFIENVMPEGADGMLAALPSLQNREAIIVGEGVTAPVRVLLDDLHEDLRPSSDDPKFSEVWRTDVEDPRYIEQAIKRWRSQSLEL